MSVVKLDNPTIVEQAADVIRDGGVIIYPTDTLYGFGVDAGNDTAVERLSTIKGRPGPWSIAVSNMEMLKRYADIPEIYISTVEDTLPGPVTLILPASDSEISSSIISDHHSIGIRIPDHPFPISLIQQLGFPITSTSVNRTGMPALNDPRQIKREFDDEFNLLIDAGLLPKSKGSTIIDLTGKTMQIVRD
ncbi:MAG: L-threonylcarbamoyladenylate synthase [Candidatus Marinimicrobia bacterium]|nr:L-threonylcarbamoyladenylate synthase [Candidatus Neomarinimicrobiota bacterium]MDP7026100.1 L-threonylcarbamoyladenylate synthase [Candidatus Neomarinimicrobiota bacterium]